MERLAVPIHAIQYKMEMQNRFIKSNFLFEPNQDAKILNNY